MLFVCGRNVDRSPTAEDMLKGFRAFDVKSAGTSIGATVPVTKELIEWADVIFAMEEENKHAILKIDSSSERKIEVLDIRDIYCRDDPELKTLLSQKLNYFFIKPSKNAAAGSGSELLRHLSTRARAS